MSERDNCPLCGQAKAVDLWATRSLQLRRCTHCELHWALSLRTVDASSSYDSNYYQRNYLGDESIAQKEFFRKQIQKIGAELSGRHVLDVGFGTGFFLEEALNQGWTVSGIELSESALKIAHTQLGDRAILISGDLRTAHLTSQTFDLITFWDVLAHVSDPRGYLLRAKELLKPGGVLVIKTPLRSGSFFKGLVFIPGWICESLLHWPWQIFYFSEFTLQRFLESLGFYGCEIKISQDLPRPRLSWNDYFKHPKGAILAAFHGIYNRRMDTRSQLLFAKNKSSLFAIRRLR